MTDELTTLFDRVQNAAAAYKHALEAKAPRDVLDHVCAQMMEADAALQAALK